MQCQLLFAEDGDGVGAVKAAIGIGALFLVLSAGISLLYGVFYGLVEANSHDGAQ